MSNGGEMPGSDVAALVGGEVQQLYINNGYVNACALRVSIALNKSGIAIPHIQDHTFQGADGKYYFLSAAKLFHYLKKVFPTPDIDMNTSQGGTMGIY
ncbi:T6SS effector amidase Tae4 family protein [Mucilaginibacter agri]|uniref:Uncharacterized protein n=1 Tax=Mucilaginibacter agri TaxID=2695265 RepID=A0A965ZIA8_9SPHI|nr:T6SS effector amidase Tae4 family protein [Mucilaginibacter agri]NCD71614.1 hypothetical protein [Mucilaginibacter agri]